MLVKKRNYIGEYMFIRVIISNSARYDLMRCVHVDFNNGIGGCLV